MAAAGNALLHLNPLPLVLLLLHKILKVLKYLTLVIRNHFIFITQIKIFREILSKMFVNFRKDV